MDDNWTKGLDSKTPRSDDKELEKSLWDEEPQVEKGSDAEDETEHVTGVFQRVAQKAMGQEKKPAMAPAMLPTPVWRNRWVGGGAPSDSS